jgi:hypothetical protein
VAELGRILPLLTLAMLAAGCGVAESPGESASDSVEETAEADAPVTSETALRGNVRATLLYSIPHGEAYYVVRVVVVRDGKRVLDEVVPSYSAEFDGTSPVTVDADKPIAVSDLDGDGEPEILLDFYWGGVHCCWWSRIYRWDKAERMYRTFAHLWGNFTYRLADLDEDGQAEFVSADNRFAYEFTSFAESSFPLRIWMYRRGELVDTTRAYPDLVAEDAEKQWRSFREALAERREAPDVRGVLAAWAADECLLDRCEAALATLRGLTARYADEGLHWGSVPEYLEHLRAFLRQTGYLRAEAKD